ncbi:hypothetical protein JCM8097_007987 [Rhodosporidiobolus ruineniae]
MASYESQVLSLIQSLPAGANPYTALDDFLWQQVVPDLPPSFRGQLIFIAVLLDVCFILVAGSLVVRVLQRSFWVVHVGSTPHLVRPHFSISWSLWAALLLVFMEAMIGITVQYYERTGPLASFVGWKIFVWLPAWYGGFTAAWSITVSYLLHLHLYGHHSLVDRLAPCVNYAALGIPLVFSICLIPPGALASHHFARTMSSVQELNELLQSAASSYTGTFRITDLASGLPLLTRMQDEVDLFARYFRVTFAVYAAFGFALTGLLGTVSFLYLLSLRRTMQDLDRFGVASVTARESQRRLMQRTYYNLIITIGAFTLLGSIFSITSIIVAHNPIGLANGTITQVFHLLPLYSFALLGTPTATALFLQSWDRSIPFPGRSDPSSSAPASKHRTRVSVSIHVVEFAESDDSNHSHSRPRDSSALPYAHARAALSLPVPDGFELVAPKEKRASSRPSVTDLGLGPRDSLYTGDSALSNSGSTLEVLPPLPSPAKSPGFAPESPIVGRWSYASGAPSTRSRTSTFGGFSSPAGPGSPRRLSTPWTPDSSLRLYGTPPPLHRLSEASFASMEANRDSVAAYSFAATEHLDAEPGSAGGSPLRRETGLERPEGGLLADGTGSPPSSSR